MSTGNKADKPLARPLSQARASLAALREARPRACCTRATRPQSAAQQRCQHIGALSHRGVKRKHSAALGPAA